ncbi:MAG: TIR domain-containing protein [Lachnospiraceae bacterium]|nr:TIR domain-containing protein [Lachnospiraceae bacterium]
MKKHFVFISYSTKDADAANLVHSYLEGNGISCWIASRNIEGGESFAVQIVDAIEDCSAFVMIGSNNSNDSDHVINELSLAFSAKKKIIPFRLEDIAPSKANVYFLQQAQWIDAYENMNDALKHLLIAVRGVIPAEEKAEKSDVIEITNVFSQEEKVEETDDSPSLTRDEIVDILLKKIAKYPYCLRDRTYGTGYDKFKVLAKILFNYTVSMYFKGHLTAGGVDYVDIIVDTLSQGQGVSIQVKGLPGCAKNMLLQLAYYKMLENFRQGKSDYLPLYLSSSYYEKRSYTQGNARKEMTDLIREECAEFFTFLKKNAEVRPVLMIEAVREHIVSNFAPEDVVMDLWQGLGKFNRIIAEDVGLVKNRQRLKRTIPLLGDVSGYTFQFHSVPIANKEACLKIIGAILAMYREKHEGIEAIAVYNALRRLRFPTLDIFTVRLVATELSQGLSENDISLVDMYERLALNELKGDEEKMLEVAHELYEYVFNAMHNVKDKPYSAILWSLPHKHNTYLEFMVAYYAAHSILHPEQSDSLRFLKNSMTSMGNRFMVSYLHDNYVMQEALLQLVLEQYDSFNVHQKSNAAYWLGKLTYAELTDGAQKLLDREYQRLLPLVKTDHRQTLSNRYNQYLFRSVCHGLISYGRTNVLDEYLCLMITNDITSAIDRGTVIQYMGDGYHIGGHNDFYLDDDPNLGEQAIRILCCGVEASLASNHIGYVETDLVSLLLLVQARMHTIPEKLAYNLTPYCKKCLELLQEYQKRPRSVISDKVLYYFQSVSDDLKAYVEDSRFDAAYTLYRQIARMKEVKRVQWLNYGIKDPESVAEHAYSAWMLAMIFLPDEYNEQYYSKQEILDMLLVHDMAESILGDRAEALSEPTKELKAQNALLRKLFLKGTYPEVANMTRYYDTWTNYFSGQNINARVARDINLIQTVDTFFASFVENSNQPLETVKMWLAEGEKLSTDLGYELFNRIIVRNPQYRKAVDNLIAMQSKQGDER